MKELDILILGVEASVAFAGFAGVIATFQFGDAKKVRRADAVGLTMIVQFSLLAALVSSVPLLLYSFGNKRNDRMGYYKHTYGNLLWWGTIGSAS